MKYFLFFTVLFSQIIAFAQFSDDFSDNDFSNNPTWSGNDALFTASSGVLNSQSPTAATYYLSTPSTLSSNAQWEFFIDLQFGTSGANYVDVYLMADVADLTAASNGYFIRFGTTSDEISLYKIVGGTESILIDGVDGLINSSSSNPFGIRVKRTTADSWSLEYDDGATGTFISAGSITDASVNVSAFFGLIIIQSGAASPVNSHFFDDFNVTTIPVDNTPPVLVSATAINANLIDVLFDEAVDPITAQNIANYDIQPFLSATSAIVDGTNPALVHIVPTFPLTNGMEYVLYSNNIEDLSGNISGSQSSIFSYLIPETPAPGDIIINEFLCDETPSQGLKEAEFVEIYNTSTKIFNVENWKINDATSSGTLHNGWLLPGEYIILTSTANIDSFDVVLNSVAVSSFPSLNNSGDDIVIMDDNGNTLDSISYTSDWYHDQVADGGGYTIERINSNHPCSGESNWRASVAQIGGTPGSLNSVDDATPDTDAPTITQLLAVAPNQLEIYFNEGMDLNSLHTSPIVLTPTLTVQSREVLGDFPMLMTLEFVENIQPSTFYEIDLENISDCWQNSTQLNGLFALPDNAVTGDVVINEIMFNPYSGGYDWVELYNNSDKVIDLFEWEIANKSNDTIASNKMIVDHIVLFPKEYIVLAEDSIQIIQTYAAHEPGRFYQMDLPTYANDKGTIYMINQNQVLDEVNYDEEWHFTLLDEQDGKSLERLDPKGISDDKNNWHTAAENIGFATPGKVNSQYYPTLVNGEFSFTSETISPDNDGFEDVLQVNYRMSQNGLVANFTIYDDRGRLIKNVFKSELLSAEGSFVWDGIRDDNTKASIGIYIAVFEAYALDGSLIYSERKPFVVAGKL